jgi:hypothetical protein
MLHSVSKLHVACTCLPLLSRAHYVVFKASAAAAAARFLSAYNS